MSPLIEMLTMMTSSQMTIVEIDLVENRLSYNISTFGEKNQLCMSDMFLN